MLVCSRRPVSNAHRTAGQSVRSELFMSSPFKTHDVVNQPYALEDYDLFTGDAALAERSDREGASFARDSLAAYGKKLGAASHRAWRARQPPSSGIRHPRPLRPARRPVRFHPSYHELMRLAIESGTTLAMDRSWVGSARRACGEILYAEPDRGGAWLPNHHDLRFDADAETRAERRQRVAAENSRTHLRSAQRAGRREDGPHHWHGDDGKTGRLRPAAK